MAAALAEWAVSTWRRPGILTLCFLVAGFLLLSPAAEIYETLHQQQSAPVIVSAVTQEPPKLDEITAIPGVSQVTMVLSFSGEIRVGELHQSLTLEAVDGTWIAEEIASGSLFPATSQMPYLVLNETAVKGFQNDKSRSVPWVESQRDAVLTTEGKSHPTILSGVVSDGREEAVAYCSLSVGRALWSSTLGSYTLRLRLSRAGDMVAVQGLLQEKGVFLQGTETIGAGWETEKERLRISLLSAGAFLLAALALGISAIKAEHLTGEDERRGLLLSGFTPAFLAWGIRLRWFLILFLSAVVAQGALLCMGSFSAVGLFLAFAVLAMEWGCYSLGLTILARSSNNSTFF